MSRVRGIASWKRLLPAGMLIQYRYHPLFGEYLILDDSMYM